jgi:hypothetical protein
MELKPCNRCGAEPIRMGKEPRGFALICPVCKKSTGYFADEEVTKKTWNEMNTDAP